MNKIKVYVYKNDFGHLLETFEKLTGNYAVGRTFIGERTITLDTPDVKEEKPARLEGWISPSTLISDSWATISGYETLTQGTRMIEILDSEIIVSEDDVRKAVRGKCHGDNEEIIIKSLFKKDGV